ALLRAVRTRTHPHVRRRERGPQKMRSIFWGAPHGARRHFSMRKHPLGARLCPPYGFGIMSEETVGRLLVLAPAALLAFLLSIGLIVLIRPWLLRHAIARPNARSSHHMPVAQGGGIAVVLATLALTWAGVLLWPGLSPGQTESFLIVSGAAIALTILGAIDDMHSLPATVRLIAQGVAVGVVVLALPNDLQVLPQLPWCMDRTCLLIAGVWFVNVTNFMDGIDWMTVAEVVPVTGAMIVLGTLGTLDFTATAIAATLCGAMLGFAPFNQPVARLFLGDAGSLPIGL